MWTMVASEAYLTWHLLASWTVHRCLVCSVMVKAHAAYFHVLALQVPLLIFLVPSEGTVRPWVILE